MSLLVRGSVWCRIVFPLRNLVLVKLELCDCNKPGGRKKLLCSALPFLPSHANVVLCLALAAFTPRVSLPHQELEGGKVEEIREP